MQLVDRGPGRCIQPPARRAQLDRLPLACGLRRARRQRLRHADDQRGVARRRRHLLRHWHERARRGLRPRVRAHAGRAFRRALAARRPQGLDQRRPYRALRDRAVPHRPRRPQGAPRRAEPVHRRSEGPGRDDPPDPHARWQPPLQRGHLRRRRAAGRVPGRPGGRRLEAGDERARLRAQRARAIPEHDADRRALPAHRARGARCRSRCAGRTPARALDDAAQHEPGDLGRARSRALAGHRGGDGEGPGHELRARHPRDRARGDGRRRARRGRCRADRPAGCARASGSRPLPGRPPWPSPRHRCRRCARPALPT